VPTALLSAEPLTLDELFLAYEEPLRRYADSLARDADRAEDLVQETMIRAMGNLGLLEQLNSYQRRAWLYQVLKNRFIDEERAFARQSSLAERLADQALAADTHPAAVIAGALLEQVPEQYREVLHAHYLLGKSGDEIAQELDIPAATVRSRLFLARKWLRAHQAEIM
jgi:RNA polymerase sigma-70 factor (ECF subfamily)